MRAQRIESRTGVRVETHGTLVFLAVWLAASLAASRAGVFADIPAAVLFVAGFLIPGGAFAAAYYHSDSFREWALAQNLRRVTLLQSLRMAGVIFLISYARGVLPAAFALPTAATDIASGLTALIAGFTMTRRNGAPKRGLLAYHCFGMLGLLISGTMGVLTSPGPLGALAHLGSSQAMAGFPLSLVPTFLGPVMLLLHLIALAGLLDPTRKRSRR
jgi:hypothetical protein